MKLSEKKIQIMEVAEKLFAENGFDGTSVRQIAKAADINVAMISYYFGSKEKLLEAMLLFRISDYMSELQSTITPAMTPLEKINCFINIVITRVHRNRRMHKIVNFEYTKDSRTIDFDKYIDQKKENYKIVEEFIKSGQQDGSFRKDITPVLVVPTILGTYLHFYYNKRFFQSVLTLPDEAAIEHYVHDTLIPHIQNTIKALLTYEK
ncbi:MAG TPA: TetR/AcrR family transcriptional regulator [Leeuwenhoekiella sp.]|nr:TetR/AcrR family transcriptional regulator [Leeuwenhoekiella sp.]